MLNKHYEQAQTRLSNISLVKCTHAADEALNVEFLLEKPLKYKQLINKCLFLVNIGHLILQFIKSQSFNGMLESVCGLLSFFLLILLVLAQFQSSYKFTVKDLFDNERRSCQPCQL